MENHAHIYLLAGSKDSLPFLSQINWASPLTIFDNEVPMLQFRQPRRRDSCVAETSLENGNEALLRINEIEVERCCSAESLSFVSQQNFSRTNLELVHGRHTERRLSKQAWQLLSLFTAKENDAEKVTYDRGE